MRKSEVRDYHERQAARLRLLLANATTAAVKMRLMQEADEHERLAHGIEEEEEVETETA